MKTNGGSLLLRAAVLIGAAVLFCSAAIAETYYVSLQGDDAKDGKTAQTAFRTVKKGVSILKSGDMLIIKSGDYGDEQAVVSNSGTREAPITIKAEETGKVILKGTGEGTGILLQDKNHVVIEGIEFGNYMMGVAIKYASSYITVRKCIFRENNSSGILVYGNFRKPEASQGIVLTENTFLDFSDKQDYGLCLYASCNLKATNNYFYGVHHQALSFKKLMKDSVASGNTFEGFRYSAIYIGQNDDSTEEGYLRSERIVAEGNVFRPAKDFHAKRAVCVANVTDAVVRNNFVDSVYGGDGEGCIAVHPISTGAKIYGNLIVSEKGNVQPSMYIEADCEVYNNTLVDCNLALEIVSGNAPVLRNNIFCGNKTQVKFSPAPNYKEEQEHKTRRFPDGKVWTWRADPAKKPVFDRNNWFPKVEGVGATDISVDPKFVGLFEPLKLGGVNPVFKPYFFRAEAYKLSKDSPCKGMGAFDIAAK
ncbi:MAG: right-handed parallel beta-helix repeat-containing protein [Candidatus Latescibacter sp.]|nr:right-handed parallel beta-helix repeat-containing protein [Candidatus Latescibacter sp.]